MSLLCPVPELFIYFLPKTKSSSSYWKLHRSFYLYLSSSSITNRNRSLKLSNALYTDHVSKLPPRTVEQDPVSLLNERIRRDHSKRDGSSIRPAMESDEA
ncbi:hypothetical protein SAY87_018719 [Trapa incisa]|uniref:Uncharacterized protein n=1 Tax=Trapa incisa TaxID=236973 RepID=A0AAN7K4K3_9MYRT|nr:hypothetical protein SAY87_018719 [Trapa incisa]